MTPWFPQLGVRHFKLSVRLAWKAHEKIDKAKWMPNAALKSESFPSPIGLRHPLNRLVITLA
jgi:hypothetical protein